MANNYQIALTNVPFDNEFNNVLRFGSRLEQEAYFDVNTLFLNAPKVNFNVGAFEITNVFVNYPAGTDLTSLMNNNYAIVKDTTNNIYYYYFVEMCLQDSGTQLALNLKMDIFQTYYIDVDFTDCNIRRAHLNRWIDNGDSTVSFDGTVDSKLFEIEKVAELPKRLTKRTKLNLEIDTTNNSQFNEWINENVLYWQYIFVGTGSYNYTFIETTSNNSFNDKLSPMRYTQANDVLISLDHRIMDSGCGVLCFPVMRTNKNLFFQGSQHKFKINNTAFEDFKQMNANMTNVYASKISICPPFMVRSYENEYIIDGNGDLIINGFLDTGLSLAKSSIGMQILNTTTYNGDRWGLINVLTQFISKPFKCHYTIDNDFTFNKSSIVGVNKNKVLNPKLLSSNFKELKLTSISDNFNYDIQKLNAKEITLLYTEALTPDVTRAYLRIETSGIYIAKCAENYTGLLSAQDNALAVQNDQLSAWLANNKNYFMQATVTALKGVATGAMGGAVAGGISGAGMGALTSISRSAFDFASLELTLDNMRSAPAMLKNANGNAPTNAGISEIGIYIEEYSSLDNELEIVNDKMQLYGFTYNKLGNIKNFDNIRHFYNYIEADVEMITSTTKKISNIIKSRFKEAFNRGVRFWNAEADVFDGTFSYAKENYERSLE